MNIKGIGLVAFVRNKQAKRLSITIKPYGGIRVTFPYKSSLARAEEFAYLHRAWIRKHLKRIKQYEAKYRENSGKIDKIDKEEARKMLVKRLRYLADKYGYSYNRVFIRNQRTRWGSCSAKNNISLNMKLIILPEKLIDYVILHELAHIREKNHSKAFWNEMDKLVENSKQLRSRLKKYGMQLY